MGGFLQKLAGRRALRTRQRADDAQSAGAVGAVGLTPEGAVRLLAAGGALSARDAMQVADSATVADLSPGMSDNLAAWPYSMLPALTAIPAGDPQLPPTYRAAHVALGYAGDAPVLAWSALRADDVIVSGTASIPVSEHSTPDECRHHVVTAFQLAIDRAASPPAAGLSVLSLHSQSGLQVGRLGAVHALVHFGRPPQSVIAAAADSSDDAIIHLAAAREGGSALGGAAPSKPGVRAFRMAWLGRGP